MTERRTYRQWIDPAAETVLRLLAAGEPEDWRDRASCATADPEEFFQEKGGSTKTAKKVCMECPVRTECLEYALEHDIRFGVWGAKSERERRALRRAA
jgi:WhiB family redox-sensing transcriptional regulator